MAARTASDGASSSTTACSGSVLKKVQLGRTIHHLQNELSGLGVVRFYALPTLHLLSQQAVAEQNTMSDPTRNDQSDRDVSTHRSRLDLIDSLDRSHTLLMEALRSTIRRTSSTFFDAGVGADSNRADRVRIDKEQKSLERAAKKADKAAESASKGRVMQGLKEYADALAELPP